MKILQIFGAVVAVHLLAFIFIFASPGCSSTPRNVPTPDATVPNVSGSAGDLSYGSGPAEVPSTGSSLALLPDSTPGRATPTRPGSPNAAAIMPAKTAAANVAPVTTYTIQKGDSLSTIAKKNHITVAELTKANNLHSNSPLKPGKKLMIPGKPLAATAPTDNALALPAPSAAAPAETQVHASAEVVKHVVASGESLGTIARKYQVRVGDLAAANNITDPAKIRVGQALIIPAGKSSGAKSAPKPAPTKPASTTSAAKHAAAPAAPVEKPAEAATQFEIKPPPAGQDLDPGLKDSTSTDVPTIKVEEPKTEEAPKN
jgi:LysM repeat protein